MLPSTWYQVHGSLSASIWTMIGHQTTLGKKPKGMGGTACLGQEASS